MQQRNNAATITSADLSPHIREVCEPQQSNDATGCSLLDKDDTHDIPNPVCPVPISSPPVFSTQVSGESAERRQHYTPRDLTVSAIINVQSIKALVDTGAVVSVIDEHFLKDIYQGHLPPLQKHSSGDVKTVSGEPLPVSERFTTTIEIANGLYSCTFLVVRNLTYNALMGRDFLQANGSVINLKDSTLKLEESTARTHSEEACPVRVLSNCIIPASSEAIILAWLIWTRPLHLKMLDLLKPRDT